MNHHLQEASHELLTTHGEAPLHPLRNYQKPDQQPITYETLLTLVAYQHTFRAGNACGTPGLPQNFCCKSTCRALTMSRTASTSVVVSKTSTTRYPRTPRNRIKLFIWGICMSSSGTTSNTPTSIVIMEYQPPIPGASPAHHTESLSEPWYFLNKSRTSSATTSDEEAAAYFRTTWSRIVAFIKFACQDDEKPLLVSHNVAFDVPFLIAELQDAHIQIPSWQFADSIKLIKDFDATPDAHSQYSLRQLAERFGTPYQSSEDSFSNIRILRDILRYADDAIQEEGNTPSLLDRLVKHGFRLNEFERNSPLSHSSPLFYFSTSSSEPKSENVSESRPYSASTLQTSSHTSIANFITTKTGRLYHRNENCSALCTAKSKISVQTLRPGLSPCKRCCTEKNSESVPAAHENNSTSHSPSQESLLAPYGEEFFKTPHGQKFHVNRQCRHLKNRVVLPCVPQNDSKDPCRTCAKTLFGEWKRAGFVKR